jgi:hypothetical protein
MNELTDKVWNGTEARLVDIKRALAEVFSAQRAAQNQ